MRVRVIVYSDEIIVRTERINTVTLSTNEVTICKNETTYNISGSTAVNPANILWKVLELDLLETQPI